MSTDEMKKLIDRLEYDCIIRGFGGKFSEKGFLNYSTLPMARKLQFLKALTPELDEKEHNHEENPH